jgi:hypothetical protein
MERDTIKNSNMMKNAPKNSTLADSQNLWIKKISHSTHNKYTTSVNCDVQLLSQL